MAGCTVYLSENHNPWFNLAVEDQILRTMDPSEQILLLYRNAPAVILGRFQNPWVECHLENMAQRGIHLVRRQTGGGAVFHDLGNLNFALFSGITDFDKMKNCSLIVNALRSMGIPAVCSERHDILLEEKKISGSAFKMKKDRAFHHGTLLIRADLASLSAILNPPERDIKALGVRSVRSPVMNLSQRLPEIDYEGVSARIIEAFEEAYGEAEVLPVQTDLWDKNPEFRDYRELISQWDWIYGKTPEFTRMISLGQKGGEIVLRVKKGRIVEASFKKGPVLTTLEGVPGLRYDRMAVEKVLRSPGVPEMEDLRTTLLTNL